MGHINRIPELEFNPLTSSPLPEEPKFAPRISVLLEMRPALDGFAGIPQETRLLFRGLRLITDLRVEGLIQTSHRLLAKGTFDGRVPFFFRQLSEARRVNRYSRVVISVAEKPYTTLVDRLLDLFERRLQQVRLTMGTLLGLQKVRLSHLRTKYFEDFIWRSLFAKSLPASDFAVIAEADHRICSTPWHTMHMVGLHSLNFFSTPKYPLLETDGIDVFISQTPYPGRVGRRTNLVVRYHDAIPVFMPHTVPDKSLHQATHFYALMNNVRQGAYFACVSDATRRDLLNLFPEAAPRAVTIHNMVSHHYFLEKSPSERVPEIIRSRLNDGDPGKNVDLKPNFFSVRERESFYRKHLTVGLKYLLVVSTIEPRKNHARLLAAWEVIRAEMDPNLKLIIVGDLGWDYQSLLVGLKSWIERGQIYLLKGVPAPDLRLLYRHAVVTVCPSLGEGFDFSGVEAMGSGGLVVASDIPVHREIYEDASEYFDPYSTASLVAAISKLLYSAQADGLQEHHRARGLKVSSRYSPEEILPKWRAFLQRVTGKQDPLQRSATPGDITLPVASPVPNVEAVLIK